MNRADRERAVTILELGEYRLGRTGDSYSAGEFEAVGLALVGGCGGCGASLGAYNAYPSKRGHWCCADCLGASGWADVDDCDRALFGPDGSVAAIGTLASGPEMGRRFRVQS